MPREWKELSTLTARGFAACHFRITGRQESTTSLFNRRLQRRDVRNSFYESKHESMLACKSANIQAVSAFRVDTLARHYKWVSMSLISGCRASELSRARLHFGPRLRAAWIASASSYGRASMRDATNHSACARSFSDLARYVPRRAEATSNLCTANRSGAGILTGIPSR